MKLFERRTIGQAESMPIDTILSFGKRISVDGMPSEDSFYIRVELPLLFKRITVDPNTFKPMYGKCRPVFAFLWYRRNRINIHRKAKFIKVWKLVDLNPIDLESKIDRKFIIV